MLSWNTVPSTWLPPSWITTFHYCKVLHGKPTSSLLPKSLPPLMSHLPLPSISIQSKLLPIFINLVLSFILQYISSPIPQRSNNTSFEIILKILRYRITPFWPQSLTYMIFVSAAKLALRNQFPLSHSPCSPKV